MMTCPSLARMARISMLRHFESHPANAKTPRKAGWSQMFWHQHNMTLHLARLFFLLLGVVERATLAIADATTLLYQL